MKISSKTDPMYVVDVQSNSIYSCQYSHRSGVVFMESMWGSTNLKLNYEGLQRGIQTGVFKRVGVDY